MKEKNSIFSEKEIITELLILLILPFSLLSLAQFKGWLFLPFAVISISISIRLFSLIIKLKSQAKKIDPSFDSMINYIKNGDLTYRSDEDYHEIMKLNEISKAFSEKVSKLKSLSSHLEIKDISSNINSIGLIKEDINLIKENINSNSVKYNIDVDELQNVLDDSLTINQEVLSSSEEIAQSIDSLYSSIDEVSAIVEQTSVSIESITTNSQSLSSSTEETSAAMIELSANAKQSVSNAQETATTAQKMKFDA
ncbi:MAG: hypothetical protein AABZ74_03930, partial [Cyanobacteriota bacterium]